MIKIRVILEGALKDKQYQDLPEMLQLPDDATVQTLIERIYPIIGQGVLVIIDGKVSSPSQPLTNGQQVHIQPAYSGG